MIRSECDGKDEDLKGTGSTDKEAEDCQHDKKCYQEPDDEVEDSNMTGSTDRKIF